MDRRLDLPPSSNAGPVVPPSPPNPNDVRGPLGPSTVANQTVSQTTTVSAAGDRLRIRMSNIYGAAPIRVGAVSVAVGDGAPVPVTFDGASGLILPAGAPRLSDPVALPVQAQDRLTISVFYPDEARLPTHRLRQVLTNGDTTGASVPADAPRQRLGALATAVEVETPTRASGPTRVIVAFGDSITEGTGSLPSGPGGWPERLAERMAGSGWAVVNAGIGGNRLLHQGSGPSALERLDADALAVSGAKCLILLEGINDIGRPARAEYAHEAVTAEDIIAGYRQVIARAHAAGLKVVVSTIPPFEDANYFTASGEAIRQSVNQWIRTTPDIDARLDYDAILRDPTRPTKLRAEYQSGDWLHPSDAGYAAMAGSIPLDVCN
ncbi:SGNH/GDSL hydrolase family protein [Brevundimonas goettingensis]|uniref:SGNH/GDSL hydrolase family protein n=1 Tax=Brevundimonas goettingensis TaxID=2774190 RepID=A0A975GWY0_9CAUL|nr:SGNH/GDSL hydrolase family protein [Brevundimonas goettingensis]QTC92304.1 SGNH/GDSL hydrolase family protein [Brevundimonas goettingensis]